MDYINIINNNDDEVPVGFYGDSSGADMYRQRSSPSPHYLEYASPQSYSMYPGATTPDEATSFEDSWIPYSQQTMAPPPSSSSNLVMIAMQLLDAVTPPKLSMMVITLAILFLTTLYQFWRKNRHLRDWRLVIWSWLDQLRERDWLEWLQIQFVELWDYAHFYSQMGMEMLRSLRLYWDATTLANTIATHDVTWDDSTYIERQEQNQHNARNVNRGAISSRGTSQQQTWKQQQQYHLQQQQSQKRNASAWADLPELEDVIVANVADQHKLLLTNYSGGSLEPAFLCEDAYPPGWLVYHSILGVVTKAEADQYQLQQKETCQQKRLASPSFSRQDPANPDQSLPDPSRPDLPHSPESPDSPGQGGSKQLDHHHVCAALQQNSDSIILPSITANG